MSAPPSLDGRLLSALQLASSLELFQLHAAIERMLADPKRILEIRMALHLGQSIRFVDSSDGRLRDGKVIELQSRRLVVSENGQRQRWTLPYAAVLVPPTESGSGPSPAPEPEPEPIRPARTDFRLGQRVSFEDRYLQTQIGVITRMNPKTASVDTEDGGRWRVPYGAMRPVVDV